MLVVAAVLGCSEFVWCSNSNHDNDNSQFERKRPDHDDHNHHLLALQNKKSKKKSKKTVNPIANVDSKQPDKVLFDRARTRSSMASTMLRVSVCRR